MVGDIVQLITALAALAGLYFAAVAANAGRDAVVVAHLQQVTNRAAEALELVEELLQRVEERPLPTAAIDKLISDIQITIRLMGGVPSPIANEAFELIRIRGSLGVQATDEHARRLWSAASELLEELPVFMHQLEGHTYVRVGLGAEGVPRPSFYRLRKRRLRSSLIACFRRMDRSDLGWLPSEKRRPRV